MLAYNSVNMAVYNKYIHKQKQIDNNVATYVYWA
jgi:hypothetical protein